jgi:hypothetical protein
MPGTIHLKTVYGTEPRGCMAQVWNADGKQIRNIGINDTPVDIEVPAGTYTLKFEGHDKTLYPAVVEVKLFEAGEVSLTIDLSQPVQAKGAIVSGPPTAR